MVSRGQGAFEYLLILGGVVLAAAVTIIIVQGSTGEVNNVLSVASNDYLSALANQQQNIEKNFSEKYATPPGCAYSNPPCGANQTCNSSNNSCYVYSGTLRNGCDYSNPVCPEGYYCKYNFCLPGTKTPSPSSAPMPSPMPSPLPSAVNGSCGSSSGANLYSAPSSNLCSAGAASAISGSGPWHWFCNGSYGGTNASCYANLVVNGACGASSGASFYVAPSSNLCSNGSFSSVTGSGPWSWFCNGSYGGTNASCSANLAVDGLCGASNGTSTYPAPSSNFCSVGTNSAVTGSGPWYWFCNGSYSGTNASCSASMMAQCNASHTLSGCSSSGGEPVAAQGCVLCRFNASSCTAGWGQFQNWSTTSAVTSTCTTASHAWANTSVESCTYNGAQFVNGYGYASLCYMYGANCVGVGAYCYCVYTVNAAVTQIGCG